MAIKKIVCLGSGSLYFTRAIPDLLLNKELSGSEVTLYDIDNEKSEIMTSMAKNLAVKAGTNFKIRHCSDLSEAIDGADFAISSIGGSGNEVCSNVYGSRYHSYDISIPQKYGINQVIGDTCGPAAMMMALRSIPAYINICHEMEKRCPKVILFNHSNPMAVLCRAMHKYTNIKVIGICHGVQQGIIHVAKLLGIPAHELNCIWIGTNHYYWFIKVMHKGNDVYPQLKQCIKQQKGSNGNELSHYLSDIYGYQIVYPEDDHIIEFYPFALQLPRGYSELPYGLSKAAIKHGYDPEVNRSAMTQDIKKERLVFFTSYKDIINKTELPKEPDDSITGEGLATILAAITNGTRKTCIVNVPNQHAISNLPADAEVEVEGVTDYDGVRPIYMGQAPRVLKGILEKRFIWQDLVADAAVKGDRNAAIQSLLIDEMAIWPNETHSMLDELLAASKDLLPQFFNNV